MLLSIPCLFLLPLFSYASLSVGRQQICFPAQSMFPYIVFCRYITDLFLLIQRLFINCFLSVHCWYIKDFLFTPCFLPFLFPFASISVGTRHICSRSTHVFLYIVFSWYIPDPFLIIQRSFIYRFLLVRNRFVFYLYRAFFCLLFLTPQFLLARNRSVFAQSTFSYFAICLYITDLFLFIPRFFRSLFSQDSLSVGTHQICSRPSHVFLISFSVGT